MVRDGSAARSDVSHASVLTFGRKRVGPMSVAPSLVDRGSVTSATSTSAYAKASTAELCNDAKFVARLFKKFKQGYTEPSANGGYALAEHFIRLDRKVQSDNFDVDMFTFKSFFRSAACPLSDKELEVAFAVLDGDGDGTVDLADALLTVRKSFGCNTQQFHDIIKRVRSKGLNAVDAPFTKAYAEKSSSSPGGRRRKNRNPRIQAFDFLTSVASLTESEAFLVLEQCTAVNDAAEDEAAQASNGGYVDSLAAAPIGELDVEYLSAVLFEFPLPDDIAYPLLMGKLVDSLTDPHKEVGGTLALIKAAAECKLDVMEEEKDSETNQNDEDEAEEECANSPAGHRVYRGEQRNSPGGHTPAAKLRRVGCALLRVPFEKCLMTQATFRHFITCCQGSLPANECDLLFNFLANKDSAVSLQTLITEFHRRIPSITPQTMDLTVSSTRAYIVSHNKTGFNALYLKLAAFGETPVPLDVFIDALREVGGIPTHVLNDITLEYLHREAPTCVGIVLLLRGQLSQCREALLHQVFQKLDADNDGLVSKEVLVTQCTGSAASHDNLTTEAGFRFSDFVKYIESLPGTEEYLSYAEFSFFWGNVSASIADDAAFTLMLWKSYEMQRDGRGPGSTRSGCGMMDVESAATSQQRSRSARRLLR